METLYKKVQFEIREKDHDQIWLIGKSANFIFNPNTINGEELFDFLSGCEETSGNSHQIEKMEADKTLYRKVAVSEEKPQSSGFYWIENIVGEMKSSYYDSRLKMFTGGYANFWLKPLTENESLLKQNEEMKAMLEKIVLVTDNFNGSFQDFKERYNSEIEKLLNKTT